MIADDQQLQVTLDRISRFQKQIVKIRQTESNPANYQKSIAGFLSEIDRMQLEVREYLAVLPREMAHSG